MAEATEVVVVGAGPAGLAVGACLRRAGLDFIILEKTQRVGSSWRQRHVVIASGLNADPVFPSVPGIEKFAGKVIHSIGYVNAKPFAGQSVLVIGMGNTGAEIALDLCNGGSRTSISLRNGVHVAPRDLFGIPIQIVAILATRALPMKVNDALFPPILDMALGHPARHGIKRPKEGILRQIAKSGKIPVLDVGTIRKIAEGAIEIAPGISAVTEDGVVFDGGSRGKFDAIIFATGFRPTHATFLEAEDIETFNQGAQQDIRAASIHFAGFKNPVTGLLRAISKDAARIADNIVHNRNERERQSR